MNQETYNYDKIAKAIEFIVANAKDQPSLFEVAEEVSISQFHFQRVFTEWAGVSPKKFLQFITAGYLKEKIRESSNLVELAELAGLSSQSRVYDHFISIEAVTPQEFKSSGKGLDISYGIHPTPFGDCFIAVTDRGICAMAFIDEASREAELIALAKKWHYASIRHDQMLTESFVHRIFQPASGSLEKLPILVQGTNFQLKVWEALLSIPTGAVTTYQQIARSIGHPAAVRAVGSAVGDNPIAYLIPCHRVIRKEGMLGEYRWGSLRKKALIGWEAARSA
ncbi:methylated-DNA--[protein]-cysteine S-methyltransferase [Dyadobacter chenwenxiniae]|uniref:methylated-DNA--[protein]-cysteine S-methyltransferase n=1 Tax=Dyadobacter chenwenxiniae TaxID=2906456 RepID=A0A9X1PLT1_9BACT|nr:methylated-DNA--[protein]-cysteine S-methyltransferase [Dyadobacter chenwenxiniae]MCF0050656.1 methylated-DNA--[protein]-cysteine S-methyltransferase [Dyadobacter chenwenxiniae]MCF0063181.1 methylated-DNA--[protein]-cysteine S-methyltransferase [Dyadobacter chenwenxiniae]UON84651.1 methylated-DNA--[protein]-cysteine S-methyltransferase [Dyadobacter chenwenxiniae]